MMTARYIPRRFTHSDSRAQISPTYIESASTWVRFLRSGCALSALVISIINSAANFSRRATPDFRAWSPRCSLSLSPSHSLSLSLFSARGCENRGNLAIYSFRPSAALSVAVIYRLVQRIDIPGGRFFIIFKSRARRACRDIILMSRRSFGDSIRKTR